MRIYGGHDYYDCALGFGSDSTVVMVRKNEKIDHKLGIPIPPAWIRLFEYRPGQRCLLEYPDFKQIHVVFCSKVYYGMEVYWKGEFLYFWQADKLLSWVSAQKGVTLKVSHSHWSNWRKEYSAEDYFRVIEAPVSLRDFMIENRYAIILEKSINRYGNPAREIECYINPHNLGKLGFAKAIDPYTAYQELSMWVGGVLAGESPKLVKVTDDKVLIENHGFDKVISFRGPRI